MSLRVAGGLAALLLAMVSACSPPSPPPLPTPEPRVGPSIDWVVFGDYPYSRRQLRQLPDVVAQINQEPGVQVAFHLGDIKEAGPCTTSYYREVKEKFDGFTVPLVYTFGDNEWTDCIKPENGGFDPQDRLAALRKVFIPEPGYTLGRRLPVDSQADQGFPENVIFVGAPVTFAVFHAVGSENGLAPQPGRLAPTPAQKAEERDRSAAASRLIQQAFRAATSMQSAAVVLMTQADFFPPGTEEPKLASGYRSIVKTIAQEANLFEGEVYLFNGDSHSYATGRPLQAGSVWTSRYDVKPVENLTRITIDGDENVDSYLKVTARRYSTPVVTWTKVPLRTKSPSGDR